jgi:DNA ligase-4
MEITPAMRSAAKAYPTGNAEQFPFHHLCTALQKCERRNLKVEGKLNLLLSARLLATLEGHSPFPILRLVLPVVDRERPVYSIKEKQLAALFCHALGFDKNSREWHMLKRFKNANVLEGDMKVAVGDFPMVLYYIVKSREFRGRTLTIKGVNDILDSLSRQGLKGQARKDIVAGRVFQNMCALEIKWFVRIVLKDLKIGVKHDRVLDYLHPDARDMFTKCSDLRLVLATLRDPNERVSVSLGLFQVFSPMLAARADGFDVTRNTMRQGFYIEWKFDGERMLVHKKGNQVKFFTRNGNDYTSKYGDALKDLVLSHVRAEEAILDGEVLVWDDGRKAFTKFGSNVTMAKAQREGTSDGTCWMCLMLFDIVYMKGPRGVGLSSAAASSFSSSSSSSSSISSFSSSSSSSSSSSFSAGALPAHRGILTSLPLKTRRKYLELLIDPWAHHLEVSQAYEVQGTPDFRKKQIERWMEEVIKCGQEGIMLKDVNSPYICGKGSKKTKFWRKLKPEYADSLSDNLDLCILAGYYDQGKKVARAGKISAFLLGVLCEQDSTPGKPVFQTIGKVGTGYMNFELAQLREVMEPFAEIYNKNSDMPSDTLWSDWHASKTDDIPDVWYRPDLSEHPKCPVVVELKAAEAVPSHQWSSGFTLRFPRVQEIRYNKSYTQAATAEDIVALQEKGNAFRKGVGGGARPANKRGGESSCRDKKRRKRGVGRAAGSGGVIRSARSSTLAVEEVSDLFMLSTFHVVLNTSLRSASARLDEKDKLSTLIRKHGGLVHASLMSGAKSKAKKKNNNNNNYNDNDEIEDPGDDTKTDFVIASAMHGFQLRNIVKQDKHDVLKPAWIDACLEAGRILDFTQNTEMYLHLCQKTRIAQAWHTDRYGDSFTEPISDVGELKKSMQRAGEMLSADNSRVVANLKSTDDYQDYQALVSRPQLRWHVARERLDVADYEMLVEGLPSAIFVDCGVCDFSRSGKATAYRMRAHGAHMVEGTPEEAVLKDAATTHAIVEDLSDEHRLGELHALLAQRRRGRGGESAAGSGTGTGSKMKEVRIVTNAWVEKCISQGCYTVPQADGVEAPRAMHPPYGAPALERAPSG